MFSLGSSPFLSIYSTISDIPLLMENMRGFCECNNKNNKKCK